MKCIVGGNAQKAKVMGNTWLLRTDKSVWLSEPTTYSLCQQWRALWSLPLMLHGNRRILPEFVPCLSLVYILFAPSCHQFVPLRNFACWWGFLICFRFFSCCPLPCSVFTPFCCFCCCCWCCAAVVVVIDPCFLITKLHSPIYSQQLSRLPIDGAAAEEIEI